MPAFPQCTCIIKQTQLLHALLRPEECDSLIALLSAAVG